MPRQARKKSISGMYHIILRGANKQEIFHDDEDCMRFLETILKCKNSSSTTIYAYCLMNNHAHLLLKEGNEELSVTMKRIGVRFVQYYHWKYNTSGHLFQDRYKSESVETNLSLLRVVRYIHQNPVKAGMVAKVDEWKWSSCLEYYGRAIFPYELVDYNFIFEKISSDRAIALESFKVFNERVHNDHCLEDEDNQQKRLSDDEARPYIKELLGEIAIAQVKSLPREQRNLVLRQVKVIRGLSVRQAARILGISPNLIYRA
ncbi:REP-associated tyrosine transposase [Litchfieldia salsa]|uniref:REP element-mobilizing transposase RayT n=1 Tax=Litchfieldia salsa TaxID=930152 RepID=A0A1H0W3W6_9BACI|nr:transposase [Litchfieldia salsa]SDP85253.1 REP element-mobilizing transposase RayT [Litchfieldia salsa]